MEIGRAFRSQSRSFAKAMRPHGISQTHASILLTLWLEGPMTMGELQAVLEIQSSTLTGLIDRMEKAALVRRVPVVGDRRSYRIEPAAWGKARREAVIDTLMEAEAALFENLTRAEHRTLLTLLRKVAGQS